MLTNQRRTVSVICQCHIIFTVSATYESREFEMDVGKV